MLKEFLIKWLNQYGEAGAQQVSHRGCYEAEVPQSLQKSQNSVREK